MSTVMLDSCDTTQLVQQACHLQTLSFTFSMSPLLGFVVKGTDIPE